jgi:hypothetical protein
MNSSFEEIWVISIEHGTKLVPIFYVLLTWGGTCWQSMCLLSHYVYLLYFTIGSHVSVVYFICFGVSNHAAMVWFSVVLPIFQKIKIVWIDIIMQQTHIKNYFLLHIPMMSLAHNQKFSEKTIWLPHSSKHIPGLTCSSLLL